MKGIPHFFAAALLSMISLRAEVGLEEGIKAHLGKLGADELPGMAVLVARDGKIVYQGGFGFADVEKKIPVTVDTKFRIGSVSKQFTAAAVLRLAEEGSSRWPIRLRSTTPDFPRASRCASS